MKLKRVIYAVILVFAMVLSSAVPGDMGTVQAAEARDDMRGVWLSFNDYVKLGFTNASEETYIKKVDAFLEKALDYNFNTVFLHVRAFDDAIWMSDTFPASSYLKTSASRDVPASETYNYDPLQLFLNEAASYDVEVHAWLNPYRISSSVFMDPGKSANISRVKKAVKELLKYDLAGIHFDDYFYHSQGGYVKKFSSSKVYGLDITPEEKRTNVNKLIKSVCKLCHNNGVVFGVSPQANYENDMASGADVLTWLTHDGYVDYLAPQIYWTDKYGADSNVTMFSDRLKQFNDLRTNGVKMYSGLALYRCGVDFSYDHGWVKSAKNMKKQIKATKKIGWDGYIMFSASYLFNNKGAEKELKNL